ncbi:uncharacterized protein LOC111870166 isoform X6 [Cryptotermes secundus]|uniref:uncharacterized protein LOC111870166 isoform X6 n=1 Tax=Cryptotermes secundus TaxID=105785 RepID=UPI000CD7D1FB|nr:uncharacterized protein LOC111870166 isoform X6 [Cryptotermes secundus]
MSSHTHAFGDYKMVDSYIHKENTDIIKVERGDVIREHSIGVENCEVYKTSAVTVKMDEPEDCMDLLKVVPGLCGEAHVVCSHIKIEEDISMDVQEEKDPLLVPFPIIKTEQEDTISLSQAEPNSHSETCLTSSHNENQLVSIKVEEVTDIQEEEDPLLITFPVTRAELRVSCVMRFRVFWAV